MVEEVGLRYLAVSENPFLFTVFRSGSGGMPQPFLTSALEEGAFIFPSRSLYSQKKNHRYPFYMKLSGPRITDGGEVVRLAHRQLFTPQEYS
jgi:hypothetical protein